MGQEIANAKFGDEHHRIYQRRLREETELLQRWFDRRQFEYRQVPKIGLEVEGWLVDRNHLPIPRNDEFLKRARCPLLVHELSKFNFEMNVSPQELSGRCLSRLSRELEELSALCRRTAGAMDAYPMWIGILPLIRHEMLEPRFMSDSNRYKALNDELFRLRNHRPVNIDIQGRERFEGKVGHFVFEAAATSLQVHIQMNQDEACRFYNASLIASAATVAAAANSPFLYGYDLWDETRIPVFEQAVAAASFRTPDGRTVPRVSFGTGFLRHSMMEPFRENLDGYPVLLPFLTEALPEKMAHLKLQNGTLWRWNRPIVGENADGVPHLRIEHRVMASGPTVTDMLANTAFYLGLIHYLARLPEPPEHRLSFAETRENFYEAARLGLGARVHWFGGRRDLQALILNELIPAAREGLSATAMDKEEISYYLEEVLQERIVKGQNGAAWQRHFVDRYGRDFQALSQSYLEHQNTGVPVHRWTI